MFRRPRLCSLIVLFFLVGIFFATTASADVILPEEETCDSSSEGDPCETDTVQGSCQPDQCCQLDYSDMDDTGVPGTSCSDCLTCQPNGAASDDENADDGNDEEADNQAEEGSADEADIGVQADVGETESDADADGGGCAATGQRPGMLHFASFVLGALLLLGVRRRQEK